MASLKGYQRDLAEYTAGFEASDPRRKLLASAPALLEASLQRMQGDTSTVLATTSKLADQIASVAYSKDDINSAITRRAMLGSALQTAAEAAIRLERYPQAEAFARRWLALPIDQTQGAAEVRREKLSAQSVLAHTLVGQGRLGDASATLQPALAEYRQELAAGAHETSFRADYAYALYVDAIAQAGDAAGAIKRKADLDAAAAQIAGASGEAQRLADMRYVSGLIAAERGK
jgi:hypothetical protein